ncbi:MAG: hypothetical protein DHS80DRAFT_8480, partial [Piptocephalis tieghemiana]
SCGQVLPRKEVRDLSQSEWDAYVTAVKRIMDSGEYARYVAIHNDNRQTIHYNAIFLVWHRAMLFMYEQALNSGGSGSIRIPYWDEGYDSQAPALSDVLSDAYYGSNGSGSKMCVQDGAFADWAPPVPGDGCITRRYDNGKSITAFHGVEQMEALISSAESYADLVELLTPLHDTVHNNVGGLMRNVGNSPGDPLFYAHHAYYDKMFYDWTQAHPDVGLQVNGEDIKGNPVNAGHRLPPWDITAGDVMDTRNLCYTY